MKRLILTVGFIASLLSTISFGVLLFVPAFYDEDYVVVDKTKGIKSFNQVGILSSDPKNGVAKVKSNFVKAYVEGFRNKDLIIEKNQTYKALCGNSPVPNCPPTPGPNPNPNPNPQPGNQVEDWGNLKVQAQEARKVTKGKGVKVCILDSGLSQHPDLKITKVISFVRDDGGDRVGHGTHVAGIISAQDNDQGMVGIAPDVTIEAMKVLTDSGSGSTDGIVQAMLQTIPEGCHVVNMSLGGGGDSQAMYYALSKMNEAGIDVFMAAGNDSRAVNVPAKYAASFPEHAFAIAATDQNDNLAQFSSRGPEIAFGAPGVDILSTLPVNGSQMGRLFGKASGTSMGCPMAAGVCALRRAQGKPCKDLGVDPGSPQLGRGRVNALKSV